MPGYLSAGGINATARGKGLTTVNLVIRSRYSFGIVAEASKQISVVQDVDLHYPLLIGEDSEKSFTLLVPPDSSLQLEDIYRI